MPIVEHGSWMPAVVLVEFFFLNRLVAFAIYLEKSGIRLFNGSIDRSWIKS